MRKPIPILLLVRELDLGGCERDLTKIALGIDRSRFEPHVGCFRDGGLRRKELDAAGIPVVRFPVTSFVSASLLHGGIVFRRYVREHGIQLLQAFDVPTCIFAAPFARLTGGPRVITSQLSYRSLVSPASQMLLRVSDRLSHRVVVNCQAMWRHMHQDEAVPESKLFLCYNGVDPSVFHNRGRGRPESLASAPLVIGSVSALRPEKRIDLLIRAFAEVRPLLPKMKLLIVGSGSELSALQGEAKRCLVEDNVVFQPATQDVAHWLRAMDIFVLPSISEAFSNALLEAMACGCCPVGSNVGGTPELIAEGERGLLFPASDIPGLAQALTSLIRDPELRCRFAATACAHAHSRLSVEVNVRRISSLYAQMLDPLEG